MSFLEFYKNEKQHKNDLSGDNDLHIFNIMLTNVYLDRYTETLQEQVTYDDITVLHLFKNDDVIQRLPSRLTHLYIKTGTLQTLPISDDVASTLETIYLDYTNLHTFPDISKCTKLREITINHSNIQCFDINYPLPNSLKTLNVRFNSIEEVAIAPFLTHPQLKLNFSFNHLNNGSIDYVLSIHRTADIKMQGRYVFDPVTHKNFNRTEIRNIMSRAVQDPFRITHPIQYPRPHIINDNDTDDSDTDDNDTDDDEPNGSINNVLVGNHQTVHLSSINISVISSVKYIRQYILDHGLTPQQNYSDLAREVSHVLSNVSHRRIKVDKFIHEQLDDIHQIFSTLNTCYMELLALVWVVVETHDQKDHLLERLYSEIADSIGKCFTGRMNRLVNVLVGYVDGVVVSISLKEEIQMSIQRLMNKFSQGRVDYKTAKDEMMYILNQPYDVDPNDTNSIISDEYKQSWIIALQDYRPSAVLCKFDHNDDESFFYISYDQLIYSTEQDFENEENAIGHVHNSNECIACVYAYYADGDHCHEQHRYYKLV